MTLDRLIRLPELLQITGLSRATIYRLIAQGEFPAPVQTSPNTKSWFASQVEEWMQSLRPADTRAPGREAVPVRSSRPRKALGRGR